MSLVHKLTFKQVAHSSLLFLMVASLVAPANRIYAQSATVTVVSGGDPEPTGEPDSATTIEFAALVALAVS